MIIGWRYTPKKKQNLQNLKEHQAVGGGDAVSKLGNLSSGLDWSTVSMSMCCIFVQPGIVQWFVQCVECVACVFFPSKDQCTTCKEDVVKSSREADDMKRVCMRSDDWMYLCVCVRFLFWPGASCTTTKREAVPPTNARHIDKTTLSVLVANHYVIWSDFCPNLGHGRGHLSKSETLLLHCYATAAVAQNNAAAESPRVSDRACWIPRSWNPIRGSGDLKHDELGPYWPTKKG